MACPIPVETAIFTIDCGLQPKKRACNSFFWAGTSIRKGIKTGMTTVLRLDLWIHGNVQSNIPVAPMKLSLLPQISTLIAMQSSGTSQQPQKSPCTGLNSGQNCKTTGNQTRDGHFRRN